MITAYQIVDLTNPVSVQYHEHSVNSLKPLFDVIKIVPVQCVTPNTLPSFLTFSQHNLRTPTEKAVLASHYNIIQKIAEGEKCFILEHDAYLWPDRVDDFYQLFKKIDQCSVWMCGVAVEFYTMSQVAAIMYCNMIENDLHKLKNTGPMNLLHEITEQACKVENKPTLWPISGNTNRCCLGSNPRDALKGVGTRFRAPITQHVMTNVGSTIEHSNNWQYSKKNNPNLYFT